MKKYRFILGIDVSKKKLDVCFLSNTDPKKLSFIVSTNDKKGITRILNVVKRMGVKFNEVLVCFETTGIYSMSLAIHLDNLEIDYWEVPAIEIKRSKGLSRGKNDKIDAKDIAFYAHTHIYKLNLSHIPEEDIMKLQLLFAEREKLVKAIRSFEMTNENKGFIPSGITSKLFNINKKTTNYLKKRLVETEQEMQLIVKENQEIQKQYQLIQTVPGVGPQTALYLIIKTKLFKAFDNWRKLACYSGIAPFEYSSGTSIKGRTKVSHFADKKMKSLLTMCALNAKRFDKQLTIYYQRKIEEGKHPMLVINSIKGKILSRVFAVINRGTPYVNTCKFAT